MAFNSKYKCIEAQIQKWISEDNIYSIVPLRFKDRYKIMKWRNEQIYHLRQQEPLTKESQDNYFNDTLSKTFNQEQPSQILFSYMVGKQCIGYGGLVHIDWNSLNAEISFIIDTLREKKEFHLHWTNFLKLIEKIAFENLKFQKIFTFAYDLRPNLYETIEKSGYVCEGILKNHYKFEDKFYDVKIHSKETCQA